MELIDFEKDTSLNNLRNKMGADLHSWNEDFSWTGLNPAEIYKRLNGTGLDVPIDKVTIAPDGTFEFAGKKVLVYIRDQLYNYYTKGYKFHIANCSTLSAAMAQGRHTRYVVSIRTDGKFFVNIIDDYNRVRNENSEEILYVCKNCLNSLNYKNYNHLYYSRKEEVYATFSINEFFKLYKVQNIIKPKHTNVTAPLNIYVNDWNEISLKQKLQKNYTCEDCNIQLKNGDSRYLHVHHIDFVKSNNRPDNLKVLCIQCHSKLPKHQYLKASPDYKEYMVQYLKEPSVKINLSIGDKLTNGTIKGTVVKYDNIYKLKIAESKYIDITDDFHALK